MLRTAFAADPLPDNNPDVVRPIPKLGIEVPEAERKKLEAGLEELGRLLDELRPPGHPFNRHETEIEQWDRYADVAIFHRAVRVALEDQEFYDPKEIESARRLLFVGSQRAHQLKNGHTPWLETPGLTVLGHLSRLDWTPQPYGLVIPPSYFQRVNDSSQRLDVWLHGRNELLTEVNFLTQRLSDAGPISPPDTLVLHPYGRYCNAFKFAGEKDVFEAIDHCRRTFRAFPVSIRGFSMGGAGCWHLAAHYPDMWFAANPGAGFAETPFYLQFNKKENLQPMWWEEKLWRWYDCPGYAANLRNLPVIAYSGEDDPQKQAADLMAAAYQREGMELRHIIGPNTGHHIHPDSAKEIEAEMAGHAAQYRKHPSPDRLELVTYTMMHAGCSWVSIRMQEEWEEACITADRQPNGDIRVTTKNAHFMWLTFPKDWIKDKPKVTINGKVFEHLFDSGPQPPEYLSFELHDQGWVWDNSNRPSTPKLRKRGGSCGPIDHAFMGEFLFVRPSGKCAHPAVQQWVEAEMERAITQWRRQFRGDVRVKFDHEVTEEDLFGVPFELEARGNDLGGRGTAFYPVCNLILWGDRSSNSLIARFAETLPIRWDVQDITVGDKKYDAAHHALIAIYPNLISQRNYIVLNSGFTFREYDYLTNARQTPKLPDWAVVDLRTPPNSRWPGKIVAADFFDEQWELKPARKDK